MRRGANFDLSLSVNDDIGLSKLLVERLKADGNSDVVYDYKYTDSCGQLYTQKDIKDIAIAFNHPDTQQYRITVEDTLGLKSITEFFVHPLENIKPGIKIVSPEANQSIVSGSFNLLVRAIVTDDRELTEDSLRIVVGGIERKLEEITKNGELTETDIRSLAEIYDGYEALYGEEIAQTYATSESKFVKVYNFTLTLPESVTKNKQTLTLETIVTDLDNDFDSEEIRLNILADNIEPSAVILSPEVESGAIEASELMLEFTAFDNVKVSKLNLYSKYTVVIGGEVIGEQNYQSPLKVIDNIPYQDANIITRTNIDTPIYKHSVGVETLSQIQAHFPDITDFTDAQYFIWLKLEAYDANGNTSFVQLPYRVNFDQRPVIDIVSPTILDKLVEGSTASVNIHAVDDVAIDHVRATVYQQGDMLKRADLRKVHTHSHSMYLIYNPLIKIRFLLLLKHLIRMALNLMTQTIILQKKN